MPLLIFSSPSFADDVTWKRLLHIKPRYLVGPERSLIVDDGFFIASQDAEAEYQATLELFRKGKGRCKYPARYKHLSKTHDLPEQACPELDEWMSAIGGKSITFSFPGSFINRPASMFGHTLLRVDGESDLLSYAISFAANTTGKEDFISYSLRGLFGGFDGYFSIKPYYEHVKTYSDIESRDIWEYPLDLTGDETEMLLFHLWELRDVRFGYYYLDENCSYHLLSLLEVARPGVSLTDNFWLYAIPSDTLKSAVRNFGNYQTVNKRPSLYSKARFQKADKKEISNFLEGRVSIEEVSDSTLIEMPEFLSFQLYKKEVEKEKLFQVLTELSKRDIEAKREEAGMLSTDPAKSHGSFKLAAGYLYRGDRSSGLLNVRPAYHELHEPGDGFIPGAEIVFLDTKLRIDENVSLEEFTFLKITSISPITEISNPVSWRASLEAKRGSYTQGPRANLDVSVGKSVELWSGGLGYLFLSNDLIDDSRFLAIGPEAGLVLHNYCLLYGSFQLTNKDSYFQFGLRAGIETLALTAELRKNDSVDTMLSASLNYYF